MEGKKNIKSIKEALENMSVNYEIKDKNAFVEFWTDKAGQDIPVEIEYDGTPEDFVKKFTEYAESYDVDDEVECYVDMRGKNGVPGTIREIIDDCQEAKDTLMELSENLKKAIMEEDATTKDGYGIKPLSERIKVTSGEKPKTLYTAIVFYSEEGVTENATFETENDAAIECKNLFDRAVKEGEMTEDIKSTSWNDGVYAGRIDWDDGAYSLFNVISGDYYSSKVCNEYLCKEYDEARLAKED